MSGGPVCSIESMPLMVRPWFRRGCRQKAISLRTSRSWSAPEHSKRARIRPQSADLYTPSAQWDPLTTVRSCESKHSRPMKFKQHRFLQIETVIFFEVSNINGSALQQQ